MDCYNLLQYIVISGILLFSERNITTTEPKKLKENTRSYSNYISNPLSCPDYFGLKSLVSVTDLFQARVHLGHRSVLRNDYMKPYIFGCRQGIDIIDLDQTCSLLFDALNFTAHIAYRQGIILFVYQNKQASIVFHLFFITGLVYR
ncbi:28S ribosomal protein S2, mitochondrial [Schistosoma japonicum]|nr:28S ribosomal protein S2, mitochondrial [Schistosoma japonicum]